MSWLAVSHSSSLMSLKSEMGILFRLMLFFNSCIYCRPFRGNMWCNHCNEDKRTCLLIIEQSLPPECPLQIADLSVFTPICLSICVFHVIVLLFMCRWFVRVTKDWHSSNCERCWTDIQYLLWTVVQNIMSYSVKHKSAQFLGCYVPSAH